LQLGPGIGREGYSLWRAQRRQALCRPPPSRGQARANSA
jgi:hypothetical protein